MLKRFILSSALVVGFTLTGAAQTEFRHISFDEALTAAKAEGKKVFIDFYTSWCGPCKRLAANVFPTKEVGDYMNSNYVCLKLDAEKEGAELAKKFGVSAYPTLIVVDTDGKALGSFAGYKEGKDFIAAVDALKDPEMNPERVKERYLAGERNGKLVFAYARNLMESSRSYQDGIRQSQEVIDGYFNSLSDADRLKPENVLMFTNYTYDYSNPRLKFMCAHVNDFDESSRAEIKKMIGLLYHNEAYRYLAGNLIAEESGRAAYDLFKKESADLGYSDEFAGIYRFIEKRAQSDDAAYLAYCDENFPSLCADAQESLVSGVNDIFVMDSPEKKKAVSSFIRKYIGSMSSTGVYTAAMAIYQLEK